MSMGVDGRRVSAIRYVLSAALMVSFSSSDALARRAATSRVRRPVVSSNPGAPPRTIHRAPISFAMPRSRVEMSAAMAAWMAFQTARDPGVVMA